MGARLLVISLGKNFEHGLLVHLVRMSLTGRIKYLAWLVAIISRIHHDMFFLYALIVFVYAATNKMNRLTKKISFRIDGE